MAGSAYLFSAPLLTLIACKLTGCDGGVPPVKPDGSWEDVYVSDRAQDVGVEPHDTRDGCGGERFNPFNPAMSVHAVKTTEWFQQYSYNQEASLKCCSVEPIAYHYFKARGDLTRFHQQVKQGSSFVDWPGAATAIGIYDAEIERAKQFT